MNYPRHHMEMGSTTEAAAMPSSTAMGGHGHGDGAMSGGDSDGMAMGMHMSMADMAMTFFTASDTPLFSDDWTPANAGVYAGTCIFLIVLAVILRVLLALRPILETRFWNGTALPPSLKGGDEDDDGGRIVFSRQPGRALGAVGNDIRRGWRGWTVGTAAARATFELAIAGVGYLLMIAVMTMNVGYFLSVLAGIWLGTFVLGSLSYDERGAHC